MSYPVNPALVESVRRVSEEAANILQEGNMEVSLTSADLVAAFDWSATPQGPRYWAAICDRLNGVDIQDGLAARKDGENDKF